jgi:hypothetical protein
VWKNVPAEYMLASGTLTPLSLGNTCFDISAPVLEPLMVMERGRVCSMAEFEKIAAENDEERAAETERLRLPKAMETKITRSGK